MAETMEQYMSKTRADYGSGISRPKIDDKDSFKLKGQFLKELCDNTFSGSDHEDANEHIQKVLEIVDLFHILNITQDQVMLRAFPMSLTRAASHWLRNKPFGSITTWEDLRQKLDETLYQAWERFKELLMKYPPYYLTEIQEKVNEKVYAAQAGCEQCKGPYYTKDCPLKEEGKTHEEAYYTQFGGPFQGGGYIAAAPGFYQRNNISASLYARYNAHSDVKDMDYVKGKFSESVMCHAILDIPLLRFRLGELAHTKLTVELADRTVKYPKGIAKNLLVDIGKFVFPVDFIILDMIKDVKVPLILRRPFLSTAHAKIDVFKRKIILRVGDEKIIFKSVKPASSLIKRVYMLYLRERMELDLEARLMGETVDPFLNRSYLAY
ncbi:reverse transcriptase domain-containing protein [Tanacetum coccineum]|uniref:Reverse transcriptase domain-containing protein n=1 Tax=Tanacetum coccineum TaxID=301880 RepID=A0ABQ5G9Z1_9ASTR